MNDNEFKNLENRYFEELDRRSKIKELHNAVGELAQAMNDLQNTNSPYQNVSRISFKVYGTSDGHEYYTTGRHDIELSNETAIDMLRKEIDKLNKQITELEDGNKNEEF